MTDLWPTDLKPSAQKSPSVIVGEQNSYISTHTDGHINLIVRNAAGAKGSVWEILSDEFKYKVDIRAPFLSNYSYNLFEFSHPVLLYPVRVNAAYEIRNELELTEMVLAANENDFIELLSQILKTETVRTAIAKIWGLSKSK